MITTELVREMRARVAVVRAIAEIGCEEQVAEEWARLVSTLFAFAQTCAPPQELRRDAAE